MEKLVRVNHDGLSKLSMLADKKVNQTFTAVQSTINYLKTYVWQY
jgi:hypothetical protein